MPTAVRGPVVGPACRSCASESEGADGRWGRAAVCASESERGRGLWLGELQEHGNSSSCPIMVCMRVSLVRVCMHVSSLYVCLDRRRESKRD